MALLEPARSAGGGRVKIVMARAISLRMTALGEKRRFGPIGRGDSRHLSLYCLARGSLIPLSFGSFRLLQVFDDCVQEMGRFDAGHDPVVETQGQR